MSSSWRRRTTPAVLAAIVASALAACGSAGQTTHTSSPPGPSSSTSAAHSSAAAGSATTSGPPATAGASGSQTRTRTSATASTAQNAPELPAQFKIKPGGALDPARVSAPPHTAIALSLISSGASHVVALHGQSYAVSADHPVHVILHGLANGTYAIKVDGRSRGALIVGVAPGP